MSATVTPINSHPVRAYATLLPKTALMAMRELGGVKPSLPYKFRLNRTKHETHGWSTEVWVYCQGGLGVNLSIHLDVWPKRFTDAREWMMQINAEYGLDLREDI